MCDMILVINMNGGDSMGQIFSPDELIKYIANMDRDNSVLQFSIPGKGRFTLVLQEEEQHSIKKDIEANPTLEKMINESREEYKQGNRMSTSDLLKSISSKDFI
jgi:hypothetical protein